MPQSLHIVPQSILDALPDAIIWVLPEKDPAGTITDFVIAYSNVHADRGINHPRGSLTGLRILADGVPSMESALSNFNHFLDVYESGKPREYSFFAHHAGRFYETQRFPHGGGVLSTTRDREAQRAAEKKEAEKSRLLNAIVEHAPVGIQVYEAIRDSSGAIIDFRIRLYNEILQTLTGISREVRSRYSFRELLKHLEAEEVFQRYVQTVETGEPLQFEYLSPVVNRWLQLSVAKLDDGMMIMITDISPVKEAQDALQKQTAYLGNILDTSLNAVTTVEAVRDAGGAIIDFTYRQVNLRFLQWLGFDNIEGQSMLERFPGTKDAGIFDLYKKVIETGRPEHREVHYATGGRNTWYDLSVARLDANTAVGTFNDITESKETLALLERQKTLVDNILANSSNGISVTRVIRDASGEIVDGRTIIANEAAVRYTGLPREDYLRKTALEIDPGLFNSPYFMMCLHTLRTGESQQVQYHLGATNRWLEITTSRMDGDHLITIFTDITSTREAQLAIERSASQLQTIINRTQTGIFTARPVFDGAAVVDFRFDIVNRAFAQYVRQEPEQLGGALASTWFPAYLTNGLFERYRKTFLQKKVERFDFHYCDDGMDIWLDIMSTPFEEGVLVTFSDYTPIKKLQLELQQLVDALSRSNASLEEFAYAASHDLQEPLRKISFFSERLREGLAAQLSPENAAMFERMEGAAGRMRALIDDLLAYSQVNLKPEAYGDVWLQEVVQQVLTDLEAGITETGALISIGTMPRVRGDERQLRQLFQNLIGNAIKYRKPGVTPLVELHSRKWDGKGFGFPTELLPGDYWLIEIRDNGIGFEPEHAEKIFKVFQRLHGRSEYAGTGVGLAIVQKVVHNHKGFIRAEGQPGEGAVFQLLLPV